ncbi:hypothetical protein [Streptomyces sp. CNS654]|uniref:zinc finger domain-containing protein n=1 Tax=Streptomyces sp. CNS654 TaxID=1506995 RepID=UPI000515C883|nr:hypothetical protein [Streptomyces sp. CNS654]
MNTQPDPTPAVQASRDAARRSAVTDRVAALDHPAPAAWLTGAEAGPPTPIMAADEPPRLDPFTEAAVRRGALLGGADAIAALPQDHECDPGRGDAVKLLRRLAGLTSTTEQPTGLTWEARAAHAVRLYATTAIERDDLRAENDRLRDRLAKLEHSTAELAALEAHGVDNWDGYDEAIASLRESDAAELEQGQADTEHLAAEFPDTIASLVDEIADDIPHRRAPQIAADYLNRHARLLAEQITALGQARGWSTWAAEYIHPDREFVDPGKDNDQAEEQPLAFPQLAVPCPQCEAPARQLCTSHSGTRQRTHNTHQARTRAYRATQAGR